jgi:phosphosulfolactate synthase (CoM biosynthesis protein A)
MKYSATVSVRLKNEPPIRIHPNPTSDHIILYHPLTTGGEKIMIADESGKAIGIGNLESDVYFTNINLDLLTIGIHYLIFASEYKNQTLKFVKR